MGQGWNRAVLAATLVLGFMAGAIAMLAWHHASGMEAALPAWIPAGSAVVTAVVTAAIFAIGRTQLEIYRQQAEIMDEQRRIARGEAYIAPVCEHNFTAALRTTLIDLYGSDDTYTFATAPEVRLRLRNYSSVPAVLRMLRVALRIQESPPAPDIGTHVADLSGDHVLLPGSVTEPAPVHLGIGQVAITRNEYRHLAAGEVFIWCHGVVSFDDLWGEQSTLHFCWQYDHSFGVFRPWPRERNFIERGPPGAPQASVDRR